MTSARTVPAGTRVGRYEIVSLLGRGGMGEVYAAHDENLGRRVALKILPSDRTSDPERVARFVREAKASSALNHPAIVSVHDAGSEGNVHFLAMELIDGESLSSWMTSRRATRARALEVMAQVAEGLDLAHANGIVHRDLKPDNIMVSRDGYAKIVDFGVAKLTERANGKRGHTGITTPTSRIGTTAYMSPEQIEGRTVDHRSDVFSFGVLLYELLAGKNPFASPHYADTLHNIVHLEPSLDPIPSNVRRIVRRCLRKDPEDRYQSMKDCALDLREAAAERDEERAKTRLPLLLGTLLILIAVLATWQIATTREPRVAQPKAVPAMLMTRLTNSGQVRSATISPDGKYLVYAEDEGDLQEMKVKQVATGTTTTILEAAPAYYYNLRVSPDSNYIYYSSTTRAEPNIVHVYQLPLLGGTPRRIAADTEHSFSLSPDGQKIVFTRLNVITREFRMTVASVDGGEEQVLLRRVKPDLIGGAVWAPDGKSITFIDENINRRSDGGLRRLDLATNTIEPVVTPKWPGVGSYTWLPDGSGLLVTAYERDQPPQIWFAPTGSTVGRKITSEISAYYQVRPTADSQSFTTVRDTTDANVVALSLDDPNGSAQAVTTGFGNICGSNGVRWLSPRRVMYSEIEGEKNT
ncbi:MAG TPA: protein kinase, partial [Thermoanaerobaculia bacterium]